MPDLSHLSAGRRGLTVAEVIARLLEYPGHHEVVINRTRLVHDIAQHTNDDGPTVELL